MASPIEFTWEQKVYIVRAFATLRTVTDILDTMHSVYGVKCRPEDILPLDPEYSTLPPDLFQIHTQTRKDLAANPKAAVPLLDPLNQEVTLANAVKAELRRGAVEKAAKLLEQLAKLQGGFFSGKAAKGGDEDKDNRPTGFSFALDKAHAEPD